MIKAISAIAIAAVVAAALTVLPGFAPSVEASTPVALVKADRQDMKPISTPNCAQQSWPNIETACLKAGDNRVLSEARLVTALRR